MEPKPPHDLDQHWCALAVSMGFWALFFTVMLSGTIRLPMVGAVRRAERPLGFWTASLFVLALALYALGLFFHLQPRI